MKKLKLMLILLLIGTFSGNIFSADNEDWYTPGHLIGLIKKRNDPSLNRFVPKIRDGHLKIKRVLGEGSGWGLRIGGEGTGFGFTHAVEGSGVNPRIGGLRTLESTDRTIPFSAFATGTGSAPRPLSINLNARTIHRLAFKKISFRSIKFYFSRNRIWLPSELIIKTKGNRGKFLSDVVSIKDKRTRKNLKSLILGIVTQ